MKGGRFLASHPRPGYQSFCTFPEKLGQQAGYLSPNTNMIYDLISPFKQSFLQRRQVTTAIANLFSVRGCLVRLKRRGLWKRWMWLMNFTIAERQKGQKKNTNTFLLLYLFFLLFSFLYIYNHFPSFLVFFVH